MTELCDLSAVDLAAGLRAGALSSVAIVESCLARIGRIDHALNAVVALDRTGALAEAARCDQDAKAGRWRGPLHGLPILIKDMYRVAGLPTTYGSPLFEGHVPDRDDDVVARLRRAGGIVLGMTNVPEWGAGAITWNPVYGATGNPFNPALTCGGSSGGAAVAVATGMVPLALGGDTGGSLRIPASYCGVTAIRPSPGIVASETRDLGWSPLTTQGPIARTAADCALLLEALAVVDLRDPLCVPPQVRRSDLGQPPVALGALNLAFSATLGIAAVDEPIERLFRERIAGIGPHFASAAEDWPTLTEADRVFEILRGLNYPERYRERIARHPDKLGKLIKLNYAQAMGFQFTDAGWALAQQTVLYRRVQAFFERYDLLITPTMPISPPAWTVDYPEMIAGQPMRSYFHWLALTYAVTLVGHPAVSIPCGTDASGLPFGLQIVGRRGGDAELLAVAGALEAILAEDSATARPKPDVARLAGAAPIAGFPGFSADQRAWM